MLSTASSSSSSTLTPHPESEQKKPKPEPESARNLIPSLPDDVALNCLARLPRSQHPTLSLVSKPIRSLLLSTPLLFNARSLLHTTELLLYLTTYSLDYGQQWFTLYRNPNVVVPLPFPPIPSPSPSIAASAFAVVGPNIYVIGGSICKTPSSEVWVLDCRFNRWQPGPTMLLARRHAVANVVDGKIYVMGGCKAGSSIWAEVLDPAVGRWDEVASPFEVWKWKTWAPSVVVDDKVYVFADDALLVYDPRNRVWEKVEKKLWLGWKGRACVVDGVLYCYDPDYDSKGKIKVLDVRQMTLGEVWNWKELKGLDEVSAKLWGGSFFADVGGKLLVVWRYPGIWGEESEIWCAEIEVNENEDAELWGNVCWSQKILSAPSSSGYFIVHCSAVVL